MSDSQRRPFHLEGETHLAFRLHTRWWGLESVGCVVLFDAPLSLGALKNATHPTPLSPDVTPEDKNVHDGIDEQYRPTEHPLKLAE